MNDTDRMARAGHYVSGLMSEMERERAERDLERDASFRQAVMTVSQRMRAIDGLPALDPNSEHLWAGVSARLAELPHLRLVRSGEAGPPQPLAIVESSPPATHSAFPWNRNQARVAVLAACFAVIFAAGYFMGAHSLETMQSLAQITTPSGN